MRPQRATFRSPGGRPNFLHPVMGLRRMYVLSWLRAWANTITASNVSHDSNRSMLCRPRFDVGLAFEEEEVWLADSLPGRSSRPQRSVPAWLAQDSPADDAQQMAEMRHTQSGNPGRRISTRGKAARTLHGQEWHEEGGPPRKKRHRDAQDDSRWPRPGDDFSLDDGPPFQVLVRGYDNFTGSMGT